MGVGVEASSAEEPYAKALRQPAYGEYREQPKVEAQHAYTEEEASGHEWVRLAKWPIISAVALVQTGWLVTLVYVVHQLVDSYVLGPLFG